MNNLFRSIVFLFILPFSFTTFANAEKYSLDPDHTYIYWKVDHFGFSHPSGKWMAEGTLILDEGNPKNSQLNATIRLGSLVTGIPKFDKHLQSDEFFAVHRFPLATFRSTQIDITGKNTARIMGNLTLHGITKPVTLNVMLNKIGKSPITQKKTAGFTATTSLKRSDFNLGKFSPGVSDKVDIYIESEATKTE